MPARAVVATRVVSAARRVAPLALEAWRRWERLPEEEKERYRERARTAARRGREALERGRRRGGPRSRPPGAAPPHEPL